jgi:hypothetical protein
LLHANGMESKLIAFLPAEGSREATLLVRRGDGQFALARIDARVAAAARLAARYTSALIRSPEALAAKR